MMEKIGRQLAANLIDPVKIEEVVLRTGLLTKSDIKDPFGNYIYYLDGERLTNDEYMQIINNCPESMYYYEKGCKQRKTGRILLWQVPLALVVTGPAVGAISCIGYADEGAIIGIIAGAGGAVVNAITSIPFFASGKHKKENAYQVYNEYCAKPTATLSFGHATKGIGMGVYLNF